MSGKDEIIIVRRPDDGIEAKKGGVWKIAHADFMTAMMAFFLIMWLVNATDEEMKKSIANYFNPLNLTQAPSAQKGLHEPDEESRPPASVNEAGQTSGTRVMGANAPGDGGAAGGGGNVEQGNENRMDSAGLREETDGAVFHDPFAVLASTASDLDPDTPVAVDVPQSTLGSTGETVNSDEARDPFDPTYWQTTQARVSQSLRPGRETADRPGPEAQLDATDRRPPAEPGERQPFEAVQSGSFDSAPSSSDPQSIAPESPEMALRSVGPRSALAEAILAAADRERAAPQLGQESNGESAQEIADLAAGELQEALANVSVEVDVSAGEERVLISLTDDSAFSMFAIGSATPSSDTVELFGRIAGVLSSRDGQIVIRGHTDARPFRSGVSDNWTLSFARAHATKTALVENGVSEGRIVRVEGLADREPSVPADPLADANRRIEILYQPVVQQP